LKDDFSVNMKGFMVNFVSVDIAYLLIEKVKFKDSECRVRRIKNQEPKNQEPKEEGIGVVRVWLSMDLESSLSFFFVGGLLLYCK
jgi:hypothetical protein